MRQRQGGSERKREGKSFYSSLRGPEKMSSTLWTCDYDLVNNLLRERERDREKQREKQRERERESSFSETRMRG